MKARLLVGATLLVALGTVTACSGGNSDSMSVESSDSGGSAAEPAPAAGDLDQAGAAKAADGAAGEARRTTVSTRAVIKKGEIHLTSKDIAQVRGEVTDLLAAVGGSLDREETANDVKGRAQSTTLVLRVPVAKFDATKKALEKLGTLQNTDESSKDVTTEVIDVEERVQTLQNSLDRLQKFQAGAADVEDLIRYEEQITRRQSELQSLEAQQAYLTDQTSLSTLTVHVVTPEKYVAPPDALEDAGFLAGLRSGWNALVDTVIVVVTILGALLPFAVVLLLLGAPVLLLVRRLLRRRTPAPAVPASAPVDA